MDVAAHDVGRILDRQPWGLVEEQLRRAGSDPELVLPKLRTYARLLLEWNRGYSNLISRNDERRIVERHLVESLEPAHWLNASGSKKWMDFGSGGGLPAIPLLLAGVGESWTLVESRRNKTLFLRRVVQDLGLENVAVELARLEMLSGEADRMGRFDGFTSRATLRLAPTLALAAEWVVPGGFAFLWKGSRREDEMAGDRSWERWWSEDGLLSLGTGQTVVVRFVRKNG